MTDESTVDRRATKNIQDARWAALHERLFDRDGYMTPGQVAAVLHVEANTLARWADLGRITAVRTPGGHRRYLTAEVLELARTGF
jgi:excisionase family DNA binding protein